MLIYNKDMMSLMYAVKMVVLLNIIRYMSNGHVLDTHRLHSIIMSRCNALRNDYLRVFVANARRINVRREAARTRRKVPIILACQNIDNISWIEKSRAKYYDTVYNYYGLKEEDRNMIETVVGLFI